MMRSICLVYKSVCLKLCDSIDNNRSLCVGVGAGVSITRCNRSRKNIKSVTTSNGFTVIALQMKCCWKGKTNQTKNEKSKRERDTILTITIFVWTILPVFSSNFFLCWVGWVVFPHLNKYTYAYIYTIRWREHQTIFHL